MPTPVQNIFSIQLALFRRAYFVLVDSSLGAAYISVTDSKVRKVNVPDFTYYVMDLQRIREAFDDHFFVLAISMTYITLFKLIKHIITGNIRMDF